MRRRLRQPTTQLARAGQRTTILAAQPDAETVRFRAKVLQGTPTGRLEIERSGEDGIVRATQPLAAENEVATEALTALHVIPDHDTAISLKAPRNGSSPGFALLGGAAMLVAIGLTALEWVG